MSIDQKPVTAPNRPAPHAAFAPVDHGRRLIRIETTRIAGLIPVRAVVVSIVLVVVIIGAGLASMTLGAYEVDFPSVIRAIA
ncbi:MAG: iron-enterobactin transporter permease, partial [Microbacterium sp.]|nr:iron-enterobactin transporter permease [Microbacterium sp.]